MRVIYLKHLTFDIDWAPQWCVEETLELLARHNVKATYFITHDCPSLRHIRSEGHNLGLHPNLLPHSSHGTTPTEAINFLLQLAPEAQVIRTHALVQSSPILYEIFKSFPQLKYDLSMLMYGFEHIGKFPWKYDGVNFERINYNWEDDCAFFEDAFDWDSVESTPSTAIYDFHPIHVALNATSLRPYQDLKKALDGKALTQATRSDVLPLKNKQAGTRTLLSRLLEENQNLISFEELLKELK